MHLTQNIYFSFASATKVRVLCYLLAEYVTRDIIVVCILGLSILYIFLELETMSFSKLAAI